MTRGPQAGKNAGIVDALAIASPELSDASLAARCRTGDHDAWRQLVERFSRYVYAIILRGYRLNADDAEDVFQDVFARAYEKLPALRDDEAIKPWLAQLTRHRCLDRLRERRETSLDDIAEPMAEPDRAIEQIELATTLQAAIEQLPDRCAEILDRFFTQDQSYRTIGAALDLPAGTIASRISRCLARLRVALAEETVLTDRPVVDG